MSDPTQDIRIVTGPDGAITGEHRICGGSWRAGKDMSPAESVRCCGDWAADHADCRCLARLR